MNQASKNPYNGPRSFQTGQRIYGRDREIRDLTGLLVAERIVLLHSPSGAGKTSLVQAGLVPRLRTMDFSVPPPMRVSSSGAGGQVGTGAAVNRYLFSLLLSLEKGLPVEAQYPLEQLMGMSLHEYLQARDDGGELVLIFDQFEEILTLDTTDLDAKHSFFAEVGKALRERKRWALFSMREDYVASLAPYLYHLPDRLATTFRLDLLKRDAAHAAMQGPAAEQQVTFSAEAAQKLAADLSRTRVQEANGQVVELAGPFVEPVQLQVVCYRLWNSLPPGATAIGLAEVDALGDVSLALSDYYNDEVAKVARVAAVKERALRVWLDRELITEGGIRSQVIQGQEANFGLNDAAVRGLIDAYLVRAEPRRGINWFELAHDRLIGPVRQSNAAWFEAHLSMLQRQADLWNKQDQPDGLLLRGTALTEAEAWAATHPDELSATIDQPFLTRCREQRAAEERDKRNQQRIRRLLWGVSGLALVAIIAVFVALNFYSTAEANLQIADQQRATAETNRKLADQQKATAQALGRLANARALAANALFQMETDPQLSLILSTYALSATLDQGEVPVPEAVNALQQAINTSREERIIPLGTSARSIAFSNDGTRVALGAANGAAMILDLTSGITIPLAVSNAEVRAVAFSPDNAFVATVGMDGFARVWDAATGQVYRTFDHAKARIYSTVFAPDGQSLLTGDNKGIIRRWDLADSSVLTFTGHTRVVSALSVTPDGLRLVSASYDARAIVWSLPQAQQVISFTLNAGSYGAQLSQLLPQQLVTLASKRAQIWNLETKAEQGELIGHTDTVYSLAQSPDGRMFATASADGTVIVWDYRGNLLIKLEGTGVAIDAVAFSPDGRTVATVDNATLRLWRLNWQAGEPIRALATQGDTVFLTTAGGLLQGLTANNGFPDRPIQQIHARDPTALAIRPDGQRLLSTSADPARPGVLLAGDGSLVTEITKTVRTFYDVGFSPDGRYAALAGSYVENNSTSGVLTVLDAQTGQLIYPSQIVSGAMIVSLAFHPTVQRIATTAQNKTIQVWETPTGQYTTLLTHTEVLAKIVYSPDGQRLIGGDSLGHVVIWDASNGVPRSIYKTHQGPITALLLTVDGSRVITTGQDRRLVVRELSSGAVVLDVTMPLVMSTLALAPNGQLIYMGGNDGVIWRVPLAWQDMRGLAQRAVIRAPTSAECQAYYLEQGCE